ncbi:DUF5518 domain-containing protein [Halopiger aswanensis]|uniref:Uncharacterized protein n=1 Tax=Halopiger aswanensis TaxID=148449 RepID=A0A3R7GKZ7_9EURY|nr:DUF5518 domain-containing protein [Halopiger aswanensis]RKD97669.1 hypothetical protein ATJ93_0660 [Halopiger aswanensis]
MSSDTAGTPPAIETYPDEDDSSRGWNTSVNALVGGVVGIVLSFIPGSAFVGGALAGYLEGGDSGDGLRVGALAGLVMLVPMTLFWLFAMTMVLGTGMPGTMGGFVFVVLAFLVLYTLGLSTVGAIIGVVLADEL